MKQPRIISQLRAKQSEVEVQIESMTARIAEAKCDLIHLAAALRLFDHQAEEPATVYHSATKALKRIRDAGAVPRPRWRPRRSHCVPGNSPARSSRSRAGT